MEKTLLGQKVSYDAYYAPNVLCAVARAPKRNEWMCASGALPFSGIDIWNAYEISWLNPQGLPQVAVGVFTVPANSPYLIESKSLKLYLNSLNQTIFAAQDDVTVCIQKDLTAVAGAPVNVVLQHPQACVGQLLQEPAGILLDTLPVAIQCYQPPKPQLLHCVGHSPVEEVLRSYLLKSNCLVTGQPDWASVSIAYRGRAMDHASLLQYLVTFRQHQEFHEQCVERIFMDIWMQCQPEALSVHARYTRRGGLDINPCRSSQAHTHWENFRGVRQ